MTHTNRSSKFGIGLVIGSVIGGLTALFLSPQSGKKNREWAMDRLEELKSLVEDGELQKKVTDIYGEATEKGEILYLQAKKELSKKLDTMKDTVEDFDHEKYVKMVKEVVADVSEQAKDAPELVEKLHKYLVSNWNSMLKNLEGKKTAKKS